MSTQTSGQALTTTLRTSFRINGRTRDRRDGISMKRDMLDAIRNAAMYPGYYSDTKTAIYAPAIGVVHSYDKHVDGYRIDGTLRYVITLMSPYQFAALLGQMVDAGVTNVGEGETFFANMARSQRAAA